MGASNYYYEKLYTYICPNCHDSWVSEDKPDIEEGGAGILIDTNRARVVYSITCLPCQDTLTKDD